MGGDVRTHDWWATHLGARFQCGTLGLTLTEVSPATTGGPFTQFSLLFSSDDPVDVTQATYTLDAPDGTTIDVFLVPMAPDQFESVMSLAAPSDAAGSVAQ